MISYGPHFRQCRVGDGFESQYVQLDLHSSREKRLWNFLRLVFLHFIRYIQQKLHGLRFQFTFRGEPGRAIVHGFRS